MTGPARTYYALASALTPPGGVPSALAALGLPVPEPRAFEAEHVLLFGRAGPAWVSPYEAAHRNAAIHDVLASFAAVGYRLDPDFRDRPDHVCAQLGVMAGLAEDAERAHEQNAGTAARQAHEIARSFFLERLWPWLPQFFEALAASTACPRHSELARVATAFLEKEGLRAGAERRPERRGAPPPSSKCRECGRPLAFPLPDHVDSRPARVLVCGHCRVRADLRRQRV